MAKSEYLKSEEAAKKQLGAKGVKKRVKQLPTAARAFTREMTGIDVSRKGVSVDPLGLAMAVSPFKLLKAGKALRAAGQIDRALGVEARVAAKALGGSRKAKGMYPGEAFLGETGRAASNRARQSSEFVFPRAPKKGPMGQPDLGDLGAGRVGLPYSTPAQIRRTNRARQAAQQGTRVTELEKRLNFPTSTRGFGTVNPEGYAALQKLPDFLGKGAKQIARKIKKTPKRGGR
jgi:hypothetical protein